MAFGAQPVTDVLGVELLAGLPGFPHLRRCTLRPAGGSAGPFALLVADDAQVGFVVVPPALVGADPALDLDSDLRERLGIDDPGDVLVLCIVTLGTRPQADTVNLAAPIVVNRANGAAAQVVSDAAGAEGLLAAPIS